MISISPSDGPSNTRREMRLSVLPRDEEHIFWRRSMTLGASRLSATDLAREFMVRFNDNKIVDEIFAAQNGLYNEMGNSLFAGLFSAARAPARRLIEESIFTLARAELPRDPHFLVVLKKELAFYVPENERNDLVKHFAAINCLRNLVQGVLPTQTPERFRECRSEHLGLGSRAVRVAHEGGLRLLISAESSGEKRIMAISGFGIVPLWKGSLWSQDKEALRAKLQLSQVNRDVILPFLEKDNPTLYSYNVGNPIVCKGAPAIPAAESSLQLEPARGAIWDLLTASGGKRDVLFERAGRYTLEIIEPKEAAMPKVDSNSGASSG